jgi:hypothetical protein
MGHAQRGRVGQAVEADYELESHGALDAGLSQDLRVRCGPTGAGYGLRRLVDNDLGWCLR